MTADILQFYSSRKKSIACPDAQQQKIARREKCKKIQVKQFCQLLNHCGMAGLAVRGGMAVLGGMGGMGGMGGTAGVPQGFLFCFAALLYLVSNPTKILSAYFTLRLT